MNDAEYAARRAAYLTKSGGRFLMNCIWACLFPFIMIVLIPWHALRLIFYIGGITGVAATSAGRAAIKEAIAPPNPEEEQNVYDAGLAHGFNPDSDSDWMGTAETRRETRMHR